MLLARAVAQEKIERSDAEEPEGRLRAQSVAGKSLSNNTRKPQT